MCARSRVREEGRSLWSGEVVLRGWVNQNAEKTCGERTRGENKGKNRTRPRVRSEERREGKLGRETHIHMPSTRPKGRKELLLDPARAAAHENPGINGPTQRAPLRPAPWRRGIPPSVAAVGVAHHISRIAAFFAPEVPAVPGGRRTTDVRGIRHFCAAPLGPARDSGI